MFAKLRSEGPRYYWQLADGWGDAVGYVEDAEPGDQLAAEVLLADEAVKAERTSVPLPAQTPHHHAAQGRAGGHGAAAKSEPDHPTLKKEIMRENNKYASRKCRQMKKEYVKCLETRVAALENQNKSLMEELNSLRDLFTVTTG